MGPQLGDGESTDDSDDETARDDDDDRRSDAEGDDDDNEVAGDDEKDNAELGYLAGHEEDDDDGGSESGGSPTSPDGSRRLGRKRPPSMQDLSIQGLSDAWTLATAAEFVNAAAAADPDDDDEHAPATFTAGNTTLLSAAALAMASPAGSPENSVASRPPGGFAAAAATREATAAEDEGAEDERATDAVDDMDDDAADATVPVSGGRKLDDALKKAAKPAFSAGSSRGHLPGESLANWLRSSVGRHRHVGHAGGVCGLGRPGAAPSRVDARSWERDFQRRDAKCVTNFAKLRFLTCKLRFLTSSSHSLSPIAV